MEASNKMFRGMFGSAALDETRGVDIAPAEDNFSSTASSANNKSSSAKNNAKARGI